MGSRPGSRPRPVFSARTIEAERAARRGFFCIVVGGGPAALLPPGNGRDGAGVERIAGRTMAGARTRDRRPSSPAAECQAALPSLPAFAE
ncbi:hypothetical protein [Microvirga mediterraneensis]|uniref:Uncharacterized protein n=1 Tax=Microvirga mediterraneensis TaxID=2754695 RepID=A0A838BPT8_9HYPH|nr:hypothetical protein [Microvirga mediterraneensis]MBA1157035.1 hypothetical protein [Microvirga mediterraneensis]